MRVRVRVPMGAAAEAAGLGAVRAALAPAVRLMTAHEGKRKYSESNTPRSS